MKRFSGRLVSAALALALASSPAFAGRYHHHDHYRGGSASGWWIGGAVALAAAGLYLAANSEPSYAQAGVYAPGVAYQPAGLCRAGLFGACLCRARAVYARAATVRAGAVSTAESRRQCAGQRVHRLPALGRQPERLRPATISQWTTQVMVDSYNRALDSCMNSRGYRAN